MENNNPIKPNSPLEEYLNRAKAPEFGKFNPNVAYDNFLKEVQKNIVLKPTDALLPNAISPFQVDVSGRYPKQSFNYDNEDLYAQGQTAWQQIRNGVAKGVVLAGTTFLEGTIGLATGLISMISDGEASSFYDNSFNRLLNDLNNTIDNKYLQNYYSEAERSRPWYQNIFTSNFLGDKFLKNMGFMAGAVMSGNMYAKLLGSFGKASAAGNALKAIEASNEAVKAGKTGAELYSTLKGFASGYNALNTAQRAIVSGLSTLGEASIEALQASDQIREKLIEEYRTNNGGILPSGEDLKKIENTASNTGNTVFGLNALILSASNYIQFPKLLASSNKAERGMFAEAIGDVNKVKFNKAKLKYEEIVPKTKFGKVVNWAKPKLPYTFSTTEMLEEGTQTAAQLGSENFWYKKYQEDDNMDLNFFEGFAKVFQKDAFSDLYGYGLDKMVTSDEGQEAMFLGGASGGFGKSIGTFKENKRNKESRKKFVSENNKLSIGDMLKSVSPYTKDMQDSVKRGVAIQQEMSEAVRQGDVLEYKDAEANYLINLLIPKIKYGRLDLLNEELDAYKQLAATEDGFEQLRNEGKVIPSDTRGAYLKRLSNIEATAKNMAVAYQGFKTATAFKFVTDKNGEIIKDSKGNPVPAYNDKQLEQLIYTATKIMDYDARIPQLQNDLLGVDIDLEEAVSSKEGFGKALAKIQSLQELNGKSVTENTKNKLIESLNDIVELTARRKIYVSENNDILKNPSKYEEKKTSPESEIVITDKTGEISLKIGKTYLLGTVDKDTKQGFISKTFPSITIIGKNSDGTIKVKDDKGKVRDMSAEEFKPYKVRSFDSISKNKKALYWFKNKDRIFKHQGLKDQSGNPREGVLRWSDEEGSLIFEYFVNNKRRHQIVKNTDLVAAKGYNKAKVFPTNQTLEDVELAEDLQTEEEKLEEKMDRRRSIIKSLIESNKQRIKEASDKIDSNVKKLEEIEESYKNLTETIETTKKKTVIKDAKKTLLVLASQKTEVLEEIEELQYEKDQIETTIPYLEDIYTNYQELPVNTYEMIEELKGDVEVLKELLKSTEQAIDANTKISNNISDIIKAAYELLSTFIKKIKADNNNFATSLDEYQEILEKYLGEEGAKQFIENNEGFTQTVKLLAAEISEYENEIEIPLNKKKLEEIKTELNALQAGYKELLGEYRAKQEIYNKFNELIEFENKRRVEEEQLNTNQTLLQKIFKSASKAEAASGSSKEGITETVASRFLNSSMNLKKSIHDIASTTSRNEDTEPDDKVNANIVRERDFLYNQNFFPSNIRENLKVRTVSIKNEGELGLAGLVESSARQNTKNGWHTLSQEDLTKIVSDKDTGVILAIYIIEKNGKEFYINKDGKILGRVGESVDINEIVYSTLSSTSLKSQNSKDRYHENDTQLKVENQSQWRDLRESLIENSQVFDITFSRGLPKYNIKNEKIEFQSFEEAFSKDQLELIKKQQGAIKVSKEEKVKHNNVELPISKGHVFLQHNSILLPLTNRLLTKEEQNTLFQVIVKLSEEIQTTHSFKDSELIKFLQGYLHWFMAKEGSKIGRNQIWISTENGLELNFGNNKEKIPFGPIALQQPENKAKLLAYLSGVYNGINDHFLEKDFEKSFKEYYLENGELKEKIHENYQTFLIDKGLVKVSLSSGRNLKQIYTILNGLDFKHTKKEEKKEEVEFKDNEGEKIAKTASGIEVKYTGSVLKNSLQVFDLPEDIYSKLIEKGFSEEKIKDTITATVLLAEMHRLGVEVTEPSQEAIVEAYKNKQNSKTDKSEATVIKNTEVKEEEPKQKRESRKRKKIGDEGEAEYRKIDFIDSQKMTDSEKRNFENFVKKQLPQFTTKELDEIIKTSDNSLAWGKMSKAVLYFYKNAQKGTGYHEAFEGVWKYFVTPEEKESILEELKNRTGLFRDRETKSEISYNEATDQQLKEKLADEFAEYQINNSAKGKIKRFFDRIIKFFRTFLLGFKENITLRDELFSKISTGGFSKYKLPENLKEGEEYSRIPGLSEAEIQSLVGGLAKKFFNILIKEGYDLMEESTYTESVKTLDKVKESFFNMKGTEIFKEVYPLLEKELKDYLKTQKIDFDENNDFYINDENRNKNDYVDSKFQLDVKKSSPFAIRFLLASLAKTKSVDRATGKITFDEDGAIIGVQQLIPFNKSFMKLMSAVSGSVSFEDSISRIESLARKDNDFVAMLKILANSSTEIDLSNLKEHQWRMFLSIYRTFNMQKPNVLTLNYSEDGSVFFNDAYFGRTQRQLSEIWMNSITRKINSGESKFFKKDSFGNFQFVPNSTSFGTTSSELITFLYDLGIDISFEEFQKMKNNDKNKFLNEIISIKTYIPKAKSFKIANSKYLEVIGSISKIAEVISKVRFIQPESTLQTVLGKQEQVYVQPNYISYFSDVFNSIFTIEELFEKFPELQYDDFAENSLILKKGGLYFDSKGLRSNKKLTVGRLNGQIKDGKGKEIDNLLPNERLMLKINSLLQGVHFISIPADASTEWTLDIHNPIAPDTAISKELFKDRFTQIMRGYLQAEIEMMSDESKKQLDNVGDKWNKLRFFRSILKPETAKKIENSRKIPDEVDSEIMDWVNLMKNSLEKELLMNNLVIQVEENMFEIPQLMETSEFGKVHNRVGLDKLLNYVVANSAIANMEMHKLIFGDPYLYKIKNDGSLDAPKRYKHFLSPAIQMPISERYNNTFKEKFNKGLQSTDFGYYTPSNTVTSIVYNDVNIKSVYTDYEDVVESDGGAIHTIFFERDLLNRQGRWGKNEADWFEWEMAFTRNDLFKRKLISEKEYSKELQKSDIELLKIKKEPPPNVYFSPKKPIVRGTKNTLEYVDPIVDKFSSYPIWYSAVKGTNLEKLFLKLYKENVHYAIFESGRKIGIGTKENFYNGKNFNESAYKQITEFNWNNYYIQTETAFEEGKKQTRGSQITKLFSIDMFDEGIPFDYTGESDWRSLSEEEKIKASKVYEQVKLNDLYLKEMTEIGYLALLKELGIEDDGEYFKIINQEKLYKTLENEALKRDMPANLKKVFKFNYETNEPYFSIDKTAKYDEIVKMLYSMVNKRIVSPKVNGSPHIQIPVTGWENAVSGRGIAIKDKGVWKQITQEEYDKLSDKSSTIFTSSELKFYTEEEPWMEVMLPHWMSDLNLSESDLLKAIDKSPNRDDILKAIGFRIPTQGMSAIENIKIKGFLPKEYGYSIVVPSEITKKAGSDFDIDKLNMYLKNVYLDKKGILRTYSLFEIPKGEKIKDFYEENLLEKYKKFKQKEAIDVISADSFFSSIGFNSDEDAIYRNLESAYVPSLEEFEIDIQNLTKIEFNRKYNPNHKKAIENEYFRTIENVIAHPKNYNRLTRPLDDDILKKLALDLSKIRGTEESKELRSLLDFNYLNNLRNAFLMAKKWVGIGAINITAHSQAQRSILTIPGFEMLLPHNSYNNEVTLSKVLNTENVYISDIISSYLNSFVDVAKDPYILQIIYDRKIVDIFMLLSRMGVPTETVVYFMNQPVIREFVHYTNLMNKGQSSIRSEYWKTEFLKVNPKYDISPAKELTKNLKSELKNPSNSQQALILNEFIKYANIASESFAFTSATKWDTTRFTSGAQIRQMELKSEKPNRINSPEKILNSTNNGVIKEKVIKAKSAIESLSNITKNEVMYHLNRILDTYLNQSFISSDEMEKIDNQLLKTYIGFLVQRNKNLDVKHILKEGVRRIDTIIKNKEIREEYNNSPLLDMLEIVPSRYENGIEKIKIKPFPKTTFEKNHIVNLVEEIRELDVDKKGEIIPNSLYDNLLKIAILQGIGRYDNLLPFMNFMDVAEYLNVNSSEELAKEFADTSAFHKNNWKDDNIVPKADYIHEKNFLGNNVKIIKLSSKYSRELSEHDVIKADKFVRNNKKGSSRIDLSNYSTKNILTKDVINKMKEKKDFSYLDKVGYKKIIIDGVPYTDTLNDGEVIYYYRQINLLGDDGIQEFTYGEESSKLSNGTMHIKTPLTDSQAIEIIENFKASKQISEPIIDKPSAVKNIIKARGKMTYSYGNNKRSDIKSETTFEAIKNGERTATTRYESDGHIDYWKNLKEGDIIEWEGKNGEKILVEVTKPLHKLGDGKIDNSRKINIYAGANENADLSNFAIRPFRIDYGASYTEFESVEQAYQAAKIEYATSNQYNFDLEEKILNTAHGAELKKLGNKVQGLDRNLWDEDSSKIMKRYILESFKQNPAALKRLLSTGNAVLTHTQDKGKWGTEFPKLLMEVRSELANNASNLAEEWSKKEGWSIDYFNSKVKPRLNEAWQIEYKLISDKNQKDIFTC